MRNDPAIIAAVREIYNRLDSLTASGNNCNSCGRCCNFGEFDHKLFVTTPELIYFKQKLASEKIKPMTAEICPYNINGKCSIYEYRFAGCRIFFCKAASEPQNRLSEQAVQDFKSICQDFSLKYGYTDLKTALTIPPEQLSP